MVQLFEPTLKPYMENLKDTLNCPDLDLVRPSIILAFSHKSSKLTIIINDENYIDRFDDIEALIYREYIPERLKRAQSIWYWGSIL